MSKTILQAVISAGGFGTRFKSLSGDTPKPLFPFCGVPIIELAVSELSSQGITSFVFLLYHKAQNFIDIIPSLEIKYNISIKYFVENTPRGEAASLWYIRDLLNDNFLFLGADILFKLSINRLIQYFFDCQADFLLITHRSTHPEDSDLVQETFGGRIKTYFLKNDDTPERQTMFLGNSGIYVLQKDALFRLPEPSAETQPNLFRHIVAFLDEFNIFSYNTTEYIHDIGTPARYFAAEKDWTSGLVHNRSYQTAQSALFIDRDNTLIQCPQSRYINDINDVRILHANIELIKSASTCYSIIWIISNQPQVSMGMVSLDDVCSVNAYVIISLMKYGLHIDGFSFCPHHPHYGFEGETSFLKYSCFCRKPRIGMFLEQQSLRNIDFSKSLMIGDSYADEEASKRIGCNFIKV
jgi:histidinol-phosphate phosphatase family protein